MKILKRSGPRIESCGTPVAILRQLLKSVSLLHLCNPFDQSLMNYCQDHMHLILPTSGRDLGC